MRGSTVVRQKTAQKTEVELAGWGQGQRERDEVEVHLKATRGQDTQSTRFDGLCETDCKGHAEQTVIGQESTPFAPVQDAKAIHSDSSSPGIYRAGSSSRSWILVDAPLENNNERVQTTSEASVRELPCLT